MQTVITTSPEETFELGRQLAESIESKVVLLLEGDLGSGKTIFAKGVAAGFGIDPSEVRSPSFTLMCDYEGRLKLYHIDLYRLDTPQDAIDHLGLYEVLNEAAVIVIEWADKLGDLQIENSLRVRLTWVDETTRRIRIDRPPRQSS